MSKSKSFLLVATLAVAALGVGQAAMAGTPTCSYTADQAEVCYPGNPQFHTGFCSCTYGTATKSAGGTYWAEFFLSSDRSVSSPAGYQGPTDWIRTYTGWSDAGAYSQEFSVWYIPTDLNCTATAQPVNADYVSAAVVYQGSNGVKIRERWTSSSNRFYSDPVILTCRQIAQ